MGTVIAAIIALAGVAISTSVSSSNQKKALNAENAAWREELAIEEKQRKVQNRAKQVETLQNSINKNQQLRQSTAKAWSGR